MRFAGKEVIPAKDGMPRRTKPELEDKTMFVKLCYIPTSKEPVLSPVIADLFCEKNDLQINIEKDRVFGIRGVNRQKIVEVLYDKTDDQQEDPELYYGALDKNDKPVEPRLTFALKEDGCQFYAKLLKTDSKMPQIEKYTEESAVINPYIILQDYIKEAENDSTGNTKSVDSLSDDSCDILMNVLATEPKYAALKYRIGEITDINKIKMFGRGLAKKYSAMKAVMSNPDNYGVRNLVELFTELEDEYTDIFPFIGDEELHALGVLENMVSKFYCTIASRERKEIKESETNDILQNEYERFQTWKNELNGPLLDLVINSHHFSEFETDLQAAYNEVIRDRKSPKLSLGFVSNDFTYVRGQEYIVFNVINVREKENVRCLTAKNVNICITCGNSPINLVPEKYSTISALKDNIDNREENSFTAWLECSESMKKLSEGDKFVLHVQVTAENADKEDEYAADVTFTVVADNKIRSGINPFNTSKALDMSDLESDGERPRLFYGREDKINEIWNTLSQEKKRGMGNYEPLILMYGPKKSGKSSLINCLKKNNRLCLSKEVAKNKKELICPKSIVVSLSVEGYITPDLPVSEHLPVFKKKMAENVIKGIGTILGEEIKKMGDRVSYLLNDENHVNEEKEMSPYQFEVLKEFLMQNTRFNKYVKFSTLGDATSGGEELSQKQKEAIQYVYQYLTEEIDQNEIFAALNPLSVNLSQPWGDYITFSEDCKRGSDYEEFINVLIQKTTKKDITADKEAALEFILELLEDYKIVVILDEFTYYAGLSVRKQGDFQFLRDWMEKGICFILSGHERMRFCIEKTNARNIILSKSQGEIKLLELKPGDAEKLMVEPMKTLFDNNGGKNYPYSDGVWKKQIANMLMRYTGNYPNYITMMNKLLFEHYENIKNRYITKVELQHIVKELFTHGISKLTEEFEPILDDNHYDNDGLAEKVSKFLYKIAQNRQECKHCYIPEYRELIYYENAGNYQIGNPKDVNYYYIEKLLVERGVIEKVQIGESIVGTWRIKVGLLEEWFNSSGFVLEELLMSIAKNKDDKTTE